MCVGAVGTPSECMKRHTNTRTLISSRPKGIGYRSIQRYNTNRMQGYLTVQHYVSIVICTVRYAKKIQESPTSYSFRSETYLSVQSWEVNMIVTPVDL